DLVYTIRAPDLFTTGAGNLTGEFSGIALFRTFEASDVPGEEPGVTNRLGNHGCPAIIIEGPNQCGGKLLLLFFIVAVTVTGGNGFHTVSSPNKSIYFNGLFNT